MRIACLAALIFVFGCGRGSPTALPVVQKNSPTVDEYKRVQIAETNEQLAAHSLRDLVETIHPGVTWLSSRSSCSESCFRCGRPLTSVA